MIDRGAFVKVFPARTTLKTLKEFNPSGYFLSNGPGDPAAMAYAVDTVKDILKEKKPLFGICLGHQLLARALGLDTYKLKFGHRGVNQPVLHVDTGRVEITSHNHGFAVDPGTEPSATGGRPAGAQTEWGAVSFTHWNLNDDTLEGLRCNDLGAFSVQYHPEAAPGPHDAGYLFREFRRLMETTARKAG
jgi:carbamoyl-phosphate synthase small subunit